MIKRMVLGASMLLAAGSVGAYDFSSYQDGFPTEDYRTAFNMGLKFFGGQRCGDSHNWMLVDNPKVSTKACHMKDGKGSVNGGGNGNYDLTGGWHDCGDHIKVGTTMGSSCIFLLVAYDLWPQAFQDNYDEAYGAPNGIADVLDEAKYATDYFMKCFPDDNTFVYYVGSPADHNVWCTSSKQSTLSVDQGGDPRPVWTTNNSGGPQAANCASALALMSMKYPDQSYKEQCKAAAIKAYAFAKKNQSQHAAIPNFYASPNTEWTDELALAAMMLYRLTGEASYKKDALGYLQGKWESNYPLAWDTMADFAYYYIVKDDEGANNGQGGYFRDHMDKNVTKHLANGSADRNGFPYVQGQMWGTNKLACGAAAATSLLVKLAEDDVFSPSVNTQTAKNFITRVVDYVLGVNEFNHTFLHGFKGDMTFRIHHRNAMGRDDNPPTDEKNRCDFMFASGGVIGGPSGTGQFSNIIEGGASYTETEGGCDYNAPFVFAMARMMAEKDPSQFGTGTPAVLTDHSYMVYPTDFSDYVVIDLITYGGANVTADLITLDGRVVKHIDVKNVREVMETSDVASGIYLMRVCNGEQTVGYKLIKR
ncbi:MAG: glycoside hydrolase family 9 protein [Paludibacteraceae bacterium]|nr:glycoside hydrolase family 9 protein [Paludibacteraceae bacterium]